MTRLGRRCGRAPCRLQNANGEPGEDQELKGTVTAIADTVWTIDGKTFTITDQTLFEGDPQVGDFVEVKFHLDADGNRIADRIELEDENDDEAEFMGIVEAIGASSWTISGRVVVASTPRPRSTAAPRWATPSRSTRSSTPTAR